MNLIGTNGSDLLIHDTSDLIEIHGKRGADTLVAEHGNGALMYGGRGADTLNGGPGYSAMWGGKGNDKFVFDDAVTTRLDSVIGDFQPGKDKIVLDLDVFGDARPAVDWFGTVIQFDTDTRELSYNGEAFAIIRGDAKITEGDFLFA